MTWLDFRFLPLAAGAVLGAGALLLSSCGDPADTEPPGAAAADADAVPPEEYYAANPEFFRMASPGDLPDDLDWRDGMDQEPFASPEAVRGGTLRSFILNFPPTIRTVGPDSNHSFRSVLLDDNSIGLVDRHPVTGGFFAALASEWAVLPDKKTVFFRLRPEARFSDGEPVTTDDFLYLFYFMQSPHIRAPWYNNWYTEEYEGITRYDEHTLAIHLANAKPEPLEFAGLRPAPAHFHGTLGPDWVTDNQWSFEPTTGPYELKRENIRNNRSIRMSRVEDWWADGHKFYRNRFNPDAKHFELVRELNIAFERFKKGDFDMFGLTLPEYWNERSTGVEPFERGLIRKAVFYNRVPRPSVGLWINTAQPLLDNRTIRKGIHHAMNFDRVIEKHFRGDFARLHTTSDGYGDFTHPTLRAREFSIRKAREYFAEAGFTEQGRDGILRDADGRRLSFTLTVPEGPRQEEAQILKEEARKAGLEINILSLEPTSSFKQVIEKRHQIAFAGWNSSLPYPRYWEGFHSDNANQPQTNNITNTADPEIDGLIERYRTSTDLDDKRALAHELEARVHEEAVFVPGSKVPFYRVGYWAWIRFPEHFDVPLSESAGQYGLYWIDLEKKKEILAERRGDLTLPNEVLVFDKWKGSE
ncbi:MAG: extracellular solute-binding protein [Puniceicoccaceae bacterium]